MEFCVTFAEIVEDYDILASVPVKPSEFATGNPIGNVVFVTQSGSSSCFACASFPPEPYD